MQPTLTNIAKEIHDLAVRENWDELAKKAEAQISLSEPVPAVMVTPPDVNAEVLRQSLSGRILGGTIYLAQFTLLADDARAWGAQRLMVVLPAGRLIDAAEVEAISRIFELRPANSYAIIISDVEKLHGAEDLELIERGAWRLLVQLPPSNPAKAELRDYGVYLWAGGTPAAFLAERLQRDNQALSRWLALPVCDLNSLHVKQVQILLVDAEQRLRQSVTSTITNTAMRTQKVAQLIESLNDFRDRLKRRLDSDAELLVNSVAIALRSWGESLCGELETEIADSQRQGTALRVNDVQPIVESKLRGAATTWGQRVIDLIRQQSNARKSDSEDMLHVVDWAAVNEAISDLGSGDHYPDTFLASVFVENDSINSSGLKFEGVAAPQSTSSDLPQNLIRFGLPVSAGVGVAGWTLVRVGAVAKVVASWPVLAPAALLAGLVAAMAVTHKSKDKSRLEQGRDFCANAVRCFVATAILHFQSETRLATAAMQRRAVGQLSTLEDLLDEALRKSHQSIPSDPQSAVRHQIEELRRQLSQTDMAAVSAPV